MSRFHIVLAMFALGISPAWAEQFWYTYEGNDYPEVEGPWVRYTRAGGAERSLEDGGLILDSLSSTSIVDEYYIETPFVLDAGESLRVDWCVRIDQVVGAVDPGVYVLAGVHGIVVLSYANNGVWSDAEGVWIDFVPYLFHEYSLISTDLETYALYIDGQLAYNGDFVGPYYRYGVGWGDPTEGAKSVSTWDFFRFGIVPEPSAGLLAGLAGLAVLGRR